MSGATAPPPPLLCEYAHTFVVRLVDALLSPVTVLSPLKSASFEVFVDRLDTRLDGSSAPRASKVVPMSSETAPPGGEREHRDPGSYSPIELTPS